MDLPAGQDDPLTAELTSFLAAVREEKLRRWMAPPATPRVDAAERVAWPPQAIRNHRWEGLEKVRYETRFSVPLPSPTDILLIGCILPALLMGSAFFSGTETALFSLTRHQRRQLMRSGHDLVSVALRSLLAETRPLLITLLLGNLTINVFYFVITTVLLLAWKAQFALGPVGIAGITAITLMLMIFLGEVLPKLIAANLAPAWAKLAALPLLAVHRSLAPLRVAVNTLIVTPLARLIAPPTPPTELSPAELEALLEMSGQRGLIDPGEENLLQQVLALRQIKVRDIMTPRVDLLAFNLADPPERLFELIASHAAAAACRSIKRSIDNIMGVVYARQFLLKQPRPPPSWSR